MERGRAGVWPTKKLGNVAAFRNGLNFLRTSGGAFIKIVGVSDFQKHFRISYDNLDTVRVSGALGPDDYLRNGDLLFVRSNGNKALIGRCILLENLRELISFSGFTIRARIVDPEVLPVFAGIYFQTDKARSAIHQGGEGSQISNLSQSLLGSVDIPVPPLREQHAIASALSDVDALLLGLGRLIVKKRDLKQAVMQQLLTGRTRLAGHDGVWRSLPLRSDITLISGQHVLAPYCNSKGVGVPYLTGPADFVNGEIQHTKYTDRPGTLCVAGDILVTVKGSGSGTLVVSRGSYCISRQLMAIRVTKWDHRFVYYSLLQNASKVRAASAGLIPGLSRSDIYDQLLPMPPTVSEQTSIADLLTDMDSEIRALEGRRAKTRALKQAMMQELLTGRTRLL